MTRYFVGDLHFGHFKVAGLRYPDVELDNRLVAHHDMVIYEQIKNTVKPDDQLWVLGDISGGKEEMYALGLLKELKKITGATFHLIPGNHDSVSSIHRNAYKQHEKFRGVFNSIQDFARMRFEGEQVLLSHYPYARSGDGPGRGEARYLEYRLPDTGMPLMHAHTHQERPHMELKRTNYGKPETVLDLQQMCVSWDVRRGLTTEAHINQWIKDFKSQHLLERTY